MGLPGLQQRPAPADQGSVIFGWGWEAMRCLHLWALLGYLHSFAVSRWRCWEERDGGNRVQAGILQGLKGFTPRHPGPRGLPGDAAEHLGAGAAMAISAVPKSSAQHGDRV